MTNDKQAAIDIFKKCTVREDHRCETDTQKEHYNFILQMSGDQYRSFMVALQNKTIHVDIEMASHEFIHGLKEDAYGAPNAANKREGDYGDWEDWRKALIRFYRLSVKFTPPQSPVTKEEAREALDALDKFEETWPKAKNAETSLEMQNALCEMIDGFCKGSIRETIRKCLQVACDD